MWQEISILNMDNGEYRTSTYDRQGSLDDVADAITDLLYEIGLDSVVTWRMIDDAWVDRVEVTTIYDNETGKDFQLTIEIDDNDAIDLTVESL